MKLNLKNRPEPIYVVDYPDRWDSRGRYMYKQDDMDKYLNYLEDLISDRSDEVLTLKKRLSKYIGREKRAQNRDVETEFCN